MPTQWFPWVQISDVAGATSGDRHLASARPATGSPTNFDGTTVSGGTLVPLTNGTAFEQRWLTPRLLPVTIAGAITMQLKFWESSNAANVQAHVRIRRVDASGAFISTIAAKSAGSEASTTEQATVTVSFTAAEVTDTTLADGDRIEVKVFGANIGTMGGGHTFYFSIYGLEGLFGDSWITFAENLQERYGPEILTAQQQEFEDANASIGWEPTDGLGSVVRTTTQARLGLASMQVNPYAIVDSTGFTTNSYMHAMVNPLIPNIIAGKSYSFHCWTKKSAGETRTVHVSLAIRWYDSTGSHFSGTTKYPVQTASTDWTQMAYAIGVAPAGAVLARPTLNFSLAPDANGNVVHWSNSDPPGFVDSASMRGELAPVASAGWQVGSVAF